MENKPSDCNKCRVFIEGDVHNNCEVCSANSRFEKYIQPVDREQNETEILLKEAYKAIVEEAEINGDGITPNMYSKAEKWLKENK